MKYGEMVHFLNDNGIMVVQAVIADEVSSQLSRSISEDKFEEVCENIFNAYLDNALDPDPDMDIWHLVDEELTKRGYKAI